MTIDIASVIIGGVLWEILKPYIFCKLIPEIKQSMGRMSKKEKAEEKPKKSEKIQRYNYGIY